MPSPSQSSGGSQSSGMPSPSQSARSQLSATPFPLQSSSHSSGTPLSLQSTLVPQGGAHPTAAQSTAAQSTSHESGIVFSLQSIQSIGPSKGPRVGATTSVGNPGLNSSRMTLPSPGSPGPTLDSKEKL